MQHRASLRLTRSSPCCTFPLDKHIASDVMVRQPEYLEHLRTAVAGQPNRKCGCSPHSVGILARLTTCCVVRSDGSRTITIEDPSRDPSGDSGDRDFGSNGGASDGVLYLRGGPSVRQSDPRVRWQDGTVDNEFLNRKKSKSGSTQLKRVCIADVVHSQSAASTTNQEREDLKIRSLMTAAARATAAMAAAAATTKILNMQKRAVTAIVNAVMILDRRRRARAKQENRKASRQSESTTTTSTSTLAVLTVTLMLLLLLLGNLTINKLASSQMHTRYNHVTASLRRASTRGKASREQAAAIQLQKERSSEVVLFDTRKVDLAFANSTGRLFTSRQY